MASASTNKPRIMTRAISWIMGVALLVALMIFFASRRTDTTHSHDETKQNTNY